MFDTLYAQIGAIFVVAVCGFAFLKGDDPERIAAGAYVLGWFASLLVQDDGIQFKVQWALFLIDLTMLVVLGALVWKARRVWPVWATALQLLTVMSHILGIVDVRPPMQSFMIVMNLVAYGVLVCLAVGTFWAWQERRAAGLE